MNVINVNVNLFWACAQSPWIIPVKELTFYNCNANQLTGFYMMGNIGPKLVNKVTDGRSESYLKLADSLVSYNVFGYKFSWIAWISFWWIETDPFLSNSFS